MGKDLVFKTDVMSVWGNFGPGDIAKNVDDAAAAHFLANGAAKESSDVKDAETAAEEAGRITTRSVMAPDAMRVTRHTFNASGYKDGDPNKPAAATPKPLGEGVVAPAVMAPVQATTAGKTTTFGLQGATPLGVK